MSTFIVTGSHGQITANAETGIVISKKYETGCPCDDSCYDAIGLFHVHGWLARYPGETHGQGIGHVRTVDILDIGYWLYDGTYEPPEVDWQRNSENCARKESCGQTDSKH